MATALCSQFGVFKSTWSQTDGVTFQVQLTRRMRASGWVADGDVPAEGDKPSSLWKSACDAAKMRPSSSQATGKRQYTPQADAAKKWTDVSRWTGTGDPPDGDTYVRVLYRTVRSCSQIIDA